ncbi:MAG: aspartate/glutamate racemase family protein [bacterium]
MRIGIFDSGLGGLIVTKAIKKAMPAYDYVYLGDTKRVPYGNRSHETVFEFTRQAVDYLFTKENCAIVIVACNTASARALRQIQQEYLPKNFPDRKVIGVLIPTAEECAKHNKVGIIGTNGTVASGTFVHEIEKLNLKAKQDLLLFHGSHSNLNMVYQRSTAYATKSTNPVLLTKVFQNPAPMLVPLAEEGEKVRAVPFLKEYLKPFMNKKFDAVALGCTHYPFFKTEIRKILDKNINVISQDEIVPKKLKEYFTKHPEIEKKLTKFTKQTPNQSKARYGARILVTDITPNVIKLTTKWFGKDTKPELINL